MIAARACRNFLLLLVHLLLASIATTVFAQAYPGYDHLSRAETVAFFAIGHTSEHLGEVQMLKGMQGLKGAPL